MIQLQAHGQSPLSGLAHGMQEEVAYHGSAQNC